MEQANQRKEHKSGAVYQGILCGNEVYYLGNNECNCISV